MTNARPAPDGPPQPARALATVWVMTHAVDYEGEDVVAVFSSLEAALSVEIIHDYERSGDWYQIAPESKAWKCSIAESSAELIIYPYEVRD
jgi:hypothetical protein